ncbi:S-adenosyl-L-methionine-dependent methyltransferase [Microthyrium microscopicum]|uniref:S-adenosyl-L-methionine-dependent methyltransferase n=1 Tax=Microthyrium microscopicum TaxID=703497 RepID=A0A6A6UI53_9PEZI|nr:S-adenosyl-L-methionine-dependent methyltransferase [Microthyrium microscopicum]
MSRPEDILPPDLYYDDPTSKKYTSNSRIQNIQASMTHRALALLNLTEPSLILDVGSGSGLSGAILSAVPPEQGGPHTWIGMDISASMLAVALERDVEGDMLLADAGQGVPFRPGTFDAAISISAVQWLCNAESSVESAPGRLKRFFEGLYASLRRGGRAVCQFYPRDDKQKKMVSDAAIKAGFGAGLLEDGGGTKQVKVYLVLTVGESGDITGIVAGMDGVDVEDHRKRRNKKGERPNKRDEIIRRKHRMEGKGKVVKATTKYTGRKRRIAF